MDRMAARNLRHLAKAPAAAGLIRDCFNHFINPFAAILSTRLFQAKIVHDFGGERGQNKVFKGVRSEFKSQLLCCNSNIRRTFALDLRSTLSFPRMQIDADGAPGPEAVVMRLARVMRKGATTQALLQALALLLSKAAGKDK